jgi:hypothetical protein
MAAPSGPPTSLDSLTVSGVPTMGMAGVPMSNGNYWFVDSAIGSDGNVGSASSPFATTTQALSKCIASNGDVIVLCPGHAETISTAGGINVNVAGVSIVGLGVGRNRPVFTFATSTAATMTITAANVAISNIVGTTSVDQIVSPFVVSAADVSLSLEWQDGAANKEAVRAILTTAAASRLKVNLLYNGFTAGTHGVNAVRLVGGTGAQIAVNYYGVASTAIVEFVTTAVIDAQISGWFYNSGTTNFSKNVVDTITGSTWAVNGFDGAAGVFFGGGSGLAVTGTSLAALGAATDAAAYFPTTNKSVMAYEKGAVDLQESVVSTTTASVMSNALTVFTIAGGPIQIIEIVSQCVTANNTTASTLQWTSSGTLGTTTGTITGASATLASAVIGTTVALQGTALSTAPVINANGVNIAAVGTAIIVPAGTLSLTIGVGSTTGTWNHYLRYKPLAKGVTVTAAF